MTIKPLAMRDAFLTKICNAMAQDEHIFFISADFGSPILDSIRAKFPERFINVGIAEQNLINVSAGLAIEGFKVFAYAIAPFITMRCYEQIRVNLALLSKVRKINVTLIGVGAGYSYVVSGPTHQCYEDLTLMRALPGMTLYSPSDHISAAALFEHCCSQIGPKYLRLDAQVLPVLYQENLPIANGFHIRESAEEIYFLATGFMVHTALKVTAKLQQLGVRAGVIDIFDLTHFSEAALLAALRTCRVLVTLEEGFRGRGGLDALMFDCAARHKLNLKILNIGVTPAYRFELGARAELHEQVGIGVDVVTQKVLQFLQSERSHFKKRELSYEISLDA